MISVPTGIQTQLGEAVSAIADSDFWERWDTLVDDLISRLRPDDLTVNTGVLQVAHSIFGRWRPLYRSDDLFTEINHVLQKFAQPFLQTWQELDTYIDSHRNDKTALQKAFAELDVVIQLFYDLSCQDITPVFEDNLKGLADLLLKYLVYDNQLLRTNDEDESGPLENVKANIFEALSLFTAKYYDLFGPHVRQFVENSWALLTSVGPEARNDLLVSKALHFLTSVSKINEQSSIFADPSTQTQIVQGVIFPNIALRDSDIEMFEDEPIEFIRRDLEGSDSETRRRAAGDLLQQLSDRFPQSVTGIVMAVVNQCLDEYKKNPQEGWRSKDTAVNLFYATAAKGTATTAHGVTTTNENVDIGDFFSKHLASDLQDSDAQALLKVDAIKYLYVFRSIITKEQWQQIMSMLVNQLGNVNYCVYTYAAVAVERALALSDSTGQPVIAPANVAPLAKDLLEHLFSLIERDPAAEKVQENEFLMRCIMRVLIVLKEDITSVAELVLRHLITITGIIHTNPSNPRFYYYHFEALGAVVRFSGAQRADTLAQTLYNPFLTILSNGVEEFMPYVFQLMAALMEEQPSKPLPTIYHQMVAPVLSPSLWEQRGNVPALARLLAAIITRASQEMIQADQLGSVLGIFQKLLSTKVYEGHAFELIETVISVFPQTALEPYWVTVLSLLMTRLSNKATTAFQLRFVRFYHFVASRDNEGLGADFFVAVSDKVQQDVFRGLYTSVILPKTPELLRPLDRKLAAVSLTKTLTDSKAFVDRYPRGWPLTCNTLLKLLENPPVLARQDNNIVDADVDDMSFGVGFTQLNTVRKPFSDPFEDIVDLRQWVGKHLKDADQRQGGRIMKEISEKLGPDAKTVLDTYLRLA